MKELDDAVYRADFEKAAGRARRVEFLHQIIIGPAGSGKMFEANNYAKNLSKAGLIRDERLLFDGNMIGEDVMTPQHILHIFNQYKSGIVIINDIYLCMTANDSLPNLVEGIINAIRKDKGPVFILTGDDRQMEKFLNQNPLLKEALPAPVYTKGPLRAEKKASAPVPPE